MPCFNKAVKKYETERTSKKCSCLRHTIQYSGLIFLGSGHQESLKFPGDSDVCSWLRTTVVGVCPSLKPLAHGVLTSLFPLSANGLHKPLVTHCPRTLWPLSTNKEAVISPSTDGWTRRETTQWPQPWEHFRSSKFQAG